MAAGKVAGTLRVPGQRHTECAGYVFSKELMMSGLPNDVQPKPDDGFGPPLNSLRNRFIAACEEALKGTPLPQIHAYLKEIPEHIHSAFQGELEEIERDYRQRLTLDNAGSHSPNPTVDDGGGVRVASPTGSGTVDWLAKDVPDFESTVVGPRNEKTDLEKDRGADIPVCQADRNVCPTPRVPTKPNCDTGGVGMPPPAVMGYEILEELGRGAFGVVYKARQVGLNRLVALKMMLAGGHSSPMQLARFHTEAQAVARLHHPNIVEIYEIGEESGLPYFSLEFVAGGSLAQQIVGQPQSPRQAAHLLISLARAMQYAHEHGIIHRDLKPGNVLIGRDGIPKITDFGLAKSLGEDSSQTQSGTLMGTPSYMAPEQARGEIKEIGPLSDVYALGAILYQLLVGRPPFLGATILDTLEQVRSRDPVPPSRLQPKVPRDLETICLKCLEKAPAKRYGSAAGLTEDLRRFLAGEPIQARPVTALERLWRWGRRNPRTAALYAAVCLSLLAVGIIGTAMARRAARERATSAEARLLAEQRLDQAKEAIALGQFRRAHDLASWSGFLPESAPGLDDLRSKFQTMQAQLALYGEFKDLLNQARYLGLFGDHRTVLEARTKCHQLMDLFDEIEQGTGQGACGLPPWSPAQEELFKEDLFEAFLVSAQVESDAATSSDDGGKGGMLSPPTASTHGPAGRPGGESMAPTKAARLAITWLNRAEKLLPPTRALYVRRAVFWGAIGDQVQADKDLDRAKTIQPQSAVDHFWHGWAETLRAGDAQKKGDNKSEQEHYRKAIGEFAATLRVRPDHFWAFFEWATCHFRLGNLADALVGFSACIQIDPAAPWPYCNRAITHRFLGQFDQVIQDCTLALERNPHYADAFLNRGLAYVLLKKADQALADLNQAIQENPDLGAAYFHRAEIFRNQGRNPEALADYDQALARNTEVGPAHFGRAAVHFAQSRFSQARDDYSAIIRLQPLEPAPYRNRGVVNILLKDFDLAFNDWRAFAKLQPENPEPFYYIGILHLGRRQYQPAMDALSTAISLKPSYSQAYIARGQVFLRQRKFSEAIQDMTVVIDKLEPNNADWYNDRSDVYRAMNFLTEAEADSLHSIKLMPKQTDAYISLALVYEKQGKSKLANECYDQMVAADPSSTDGYLRRAEFRRNRGKFTEALLDCDQAARLAPNSLLPGLVRASIQAAQGDHSRAVAEADQLLKRSAQGDGHVLYAGACVWSLASQAAAKGARESTLARQYADRAAELLAQAMDKGFHDLSYQEHNRLAEDPALAPIRTDPRVTGGPSP